MNPFEILGIKESILPDLREVRKHFLELQRGEHPDFGSNGEISELANQAYAILLDDVQRVKAILTIHGITDLNEHGLGPDFLMEMMDISDEIEEGKSDNPELLETVKQRIQSILDELKDELKELHKVQVIFNYSIKDFPEDFVGQLMNWYQRHKYLSRLEKNALGIKEM